MGVGAERERAIGRRERIADSPYMNIVSGRICAEETARLEIQA